MEIEEVEIKKITQDENIRGRISDKSVANLMRSIKNDGLLQPIGVFRDGRRYEIIFGNRRLEACKKLGWKTIPSQIFESQGDKEIIIKNAVENIQRENVNSFEEGRIFDMLQRKYDMTVSEIGARFGIARSKVRASINVFQEIPEDYRDYVIPQSGGRGTKKGKIPLSVANQIINSYKYNRINKEQARILFREARKDEFTLKHLTLLTYFLSKKMAFKEALEWCKDYKFMAFKLPMKQEEIDKKCRKHKMGQEELVIAILRGDIEETFNIPKIYEK